MSRSYTSFPPQASPWHVVGLLYLTSYFYYNDVHSSLKKLATEAISWNMAMLRRPWT
jgi:hypothetical protein